jgi:hypothetical protein
LAHSPRTQISRFAPAARPHGASSKLAQSSILQHLSRTCGFPTVACRDCQRDSVVKEPSFRFHRNVRPARSGNKKPGVERRAHPPHWRIRSSARLVLAAVRNRPHSKLGLEPEPAVIP